MGDLVGSMQSYLNACGVKSEIQMIGILFNVAGERVREIYKTSAAAKDDDDFKAVVKILTDHFKPKSALMYQASLFYEMRQSKQESLDDFHVRLRLQTALCGWKDDRLDDELKIQLIRGCKSLKLKEDILKLDDSKKVADILTFARASEAAKDQAMAMESSEPSTKIKTEPIAAVEKRKLRTSATNLTRMRVKR